ncbi:DUF4153 domain-containing protein [Micromonospora profundi]|uniref:DUF4153 domain-containing protein n=1 Tax=Micromonospora TaxID=1873 RepID=UPI0033A399FD
MTSPGSTSAPATGPVGRPPAPGQPWFGPGPASPPTAGQSRPWPAPPLPPRQPSFVDKHWPGPSRAPHPLLLTVLAVAAALGASTLTVVRPGLGWLVAALAATAALAVAGAVRPGTSSPAGSTGQTSPGDAPAARQAPPPAAASAPTAAGPTPVTPSPAATSTSGPTPATAPPAAPSASGLPPGTPSPAAASTATPVAPPADSKPAATAATSPEASTAARSEPEPTETAAPTTAPPPAVTPTPAAATPPAAPTTARPAATTPSPSTAAAAAPAVATARPDATGAPGRAAQAAWAAATVALVAVGTVRAAGWLFVLCLLAAAVTATLAVTGGRTPLGMLVAATLPPAAAVRAMPWAVRGLHRTGPVGPGIGRIITSLAVSAGLLTLFGLLFASADAVFADLVSGLLPDISFAGLFNWLMRLGIVGMGLLAGAYLVNRPPDLASLRATPGRPAHRLEWILPLVLLDALFTVFVLVQLTVFFGGAGHVLRTAGLTYAEYARGGFWQLLAVTALTLLVIAVAARRAPKATRADRILVRVLLGALTVLSLVVVASALYRMQVYADAYGATRLRLFVATVELWLGLLFVLVAVAVARLRADWLPRLVIGTAVLALLGLALVNPDRLIADRNVDRYLETGRLDVSYLSGLSADAVPALDRLPEPMRTCALGQIAAELPQDGFWATNLGREEARRVLGPMPVTGSLVDCPGLRRW